MEPEMFMPITRIDHVSEHCNYVINSPDENNNIVVVHPHGSDPTRTYI